MRSLRLVPALASLLVAALLASVLVVGAAGVEPAGAAGSTPVMGRNRVSAADLAAWFRSKAKTSKATVSIDALAALFISEGADEGVAGDIAFAQAIIESGYFTFSSRTPASYNNFSGLGAVDGGSGAASFATAQLGVRAQIQHLRAYADPTVTTAKLAHPLVDPRFRYVLPKGKAPTWEQFGNGTWASASDYASKVLGVYLQIVAFAGRPPATDLAPFTSAGQVVDQAYADILGRTPTAAERAAGAASLQEGTRTPAGLLADLVGGEGTADAQPVARLYLAALGRLPDRGGLQYWTRRHAAGVRLVRLAEQFIASSEFVRRYGTPNDSGFVVVLYRNVLDRSADPAGTDYWVQRLVAGQMSHTQVLVQFSESNEHRTKTRPTTEASLVYLGMVLRAPDRSVLTWWATKRSSGSELEVLTDLVYDSSAYRLRFA